MGTAGMALEQTRARLLARPARRYTPGLDLPALRTDVIWRGALNCPSF